MYNIKLKELDEIIEKTVDSIKNSQVDIREISSFAKSEYLELEDEFMHLKIEASNVIDRVDLLVMQLKESKKLLSKVNKEYTKYSEDEMRKIYEQTDALRLTLVVEKEREINIINRRNELELHLKSIRKISDKADNLVNNFDMAYSVLTGDLKNLTEKIDDMQSRQIWGVKVIQAQELERERIARDMHDGPAQSLSNLIIKTELCIKLLDKDAARTRLELQTLKSLLRTTIDDTRRLIYNLRPMSIDDLGLIPTIERLIDKTNKQLDYNIELKTNSKANKINNPMITLTLYRIAQEALNNIKKYSEATRSIIDINVLEDYIELAITDNGIGFDINNIKLNLEDNKGFGIAIMKERTSLLMGDFNIVSETGKGTTLTARIPLKEGENDE